VSGTFYRLLLPMGPPFIFTIGHVDSLPSDYIGLRFAQDTGVGLSILDNLSDSLCLFPELCIFGHTYRLKCLVSDLPNLRILTNNLIQA